MYLSRLVVIGVLASMFSASHVAIAEPGTAQPAALRRISSAALGSPALAGDQVFWREAQGQRTSIRGYDLGANAPIGVAVRDGAILDLAADGRRVAWVERDAAGQVGILS